MYCFTPRWTTPLLAALLLLAAAPAALAQVSSETIAELSRKQAEARAAVEAVNGEFMDALGRADAEALAALYAEDAMLMPPAGDFVEGREDIAMFFGHVFEAGITGGMLETVEFELHGTTAIEVGRFMFYADGEVADHGKYIAVWKLQDGAWRLHRDIFNSSVPGNEE